eukprot:scaffold2870_cov151-Skeletonema_dohrnii-CCMP3373.AAC.4
MGYPEVTGHILGPIRSPEFYYFNKPFRVMSFISGIAYIIHHSGVWLIHGIMQSSLTIYMNMNDDSAGKIEDEEDSIPLETKANSANSTRSMSGNLHRHRSLRLFRRSLDLHSTAIDYSIDIESESDKSMDDVEDTCTLPATTTIDELSPEPDSSVPAQRRSLDGSLDKQGSLRLSQSSVQSINEEERGKNENNDTCKAPDTTTPSVGDQAHKINGSRRSMMLRLGSSPSILVSQKSRLFDPSEVMNLMGFDESTTNGKEELTRIDEEAESEAF